MLPELARHLTLFSFKVALLAATLGPLALGEWLLRRERAQRWREYLFLFVCGILGSAVACGADLVTGNLSRTYFIAGKGAPQGEGFFPFILARGIESGFMAGAVGAGLILIANSTWKRWPPLNIRRLQRYPVWVLLAAVSTAVIGMLLSPLATPRLFQGIEDLPQEDQTNVMRVLSIHGGLYAGAILGVGTSAFQLARTRQIESLRRPTDAADVTNSIVIASQPR